MKQILFKTIACCAALLTFASCEKSGDLLDDGSGSGSIYLNLSSGEGPAPSSRAFETGYDASFETRVDHLDVLIFDASGNKKHYERIETGAASSGKIALTAQRSDFAEGVGYWVHLIANATDDEQAKFQEANYNRNALLSEVRYNPYIHLTGMSTNNHGAGYDLPQNFLMDGTAYTTATEPAPDKAAPVELNNGDSQADTNLKVTLRRAAVKLMLNIEKGPRIMITDPLDLSGVANTSGYYLRNMPFTSFLLPNAGYREDVRTPLQTRNHYFELHWTELDPSDPEGQARIIDNIVVTAYVYSHDWTHKSNVQQEPRWIVDIPLKYETNPSGDAGSKDRELQPYEHSYYQIPVCQGTELKRNTCYKVNVVINQPGGNNPSQAATLKDVQYTVVDPWIEKTITIGGEESRPMFLTVNRTEMEMHNVDKDEMTLEFASSSDVTAEINTDESGQAQIYYYDKFGQKTYLEKKYPDNPDDYTWLGESYVNDKGETTNEHQIHIVPDAGLNGKIKIYSEGPKNNSIRYIELKVTNKDNVTPRYVTIKQYPLEYILNILGWYSYRTDFLHDENDETTVTTYELLNGVDVKGKTYTSAPFSANDWICGCSWNSSRNRWDYGAATIGFFGSKVAGPVATSGRNSGKAHIYYYRWERTNNGSSYRPRYTYSVDDNSYDVWNGYANPRMYHVRLTASSDKYTIGRPRITDGKTDPGEDNAKLVSPSFMIASQLGAVMDAPNVNVAADHCKHYVEVYKDKNGKAVHLNDWRLPTAAEIGIIIGFQQTSDAMDEVLAGKSYWSASGLVATSGTTGSGTHRIRCIRDAYDLQDDDNKDAGATTDTATDAQ